MARSRSILFTALLPLALLATPGAADAATVSVKRVTLSDPGETKETLATVRVLAAPGEANSLVLRTSGRAIVVRDAVRLKAGKGCAAVAGGAVRCAPKDLLNVEVRAGDGDDAVDVRRVTGFVKVFGGAGDDSLVGPQRGLSALAGDAGADVISGSGPLDGGPGPDRITGSAGTDAITPDGPGEDVADDIVDGRGGRDQVSYKERTLPVTIDLLDPAPDGAAGERDTLIAIEDVLGGAGADRLLGDDGPNVLEGSPLEPAVATGDELDGRGGDDRLVGGTQDDVLRGGPGDDGLDGKRGNDIFDGGEGDDFLSGVGELGDSNRRPVLSATACGGGVDTLLSPPPGVSLPSDCEGLAFYDAQLTVLGVDRARSQLRVRVGSEDRSLGAPCRVRLRAGGRAKVVRVRGARSRRVTLRYRPASGGRARLRIDYAQRCGAGRFGRAETFVLRLPGKAGG